MNTQFYTVSGSNKEWTATVFEGNNVLGKIDATSEKQAHFLAALEYPSALTPAKMNKILDKDYNSAAGKAYRAKQARS